MKEKTVYTKWIAYELRKQGFRFIRADINPHYPQYYCYVFEDSKELRETMDALSKSRK